MQRETVINSQEDLKIKYTSHLYQSTGFDRRRPLHETRQNQPQTKVSTSYETIHPPVPRRLPSPPTVPTNNNNERAQSINHSRTSLSNESKPMAWSSTTTTTITANKARTMARSTEQEGEQRELNTLNDRFGNYLEKIKHLAGVNTNLRRQVDDAYRKYIGHTAEEQDHGINQSKLATKYQHPSELQLNQLRQQINEQVRAQTLIQIRCQRADYDVKFYQKNLQLFNSHDQKQAEQIRTMRQQLDVNLHEFDQLKQQYNRREQDLQLCKSQYNEYIKKLVDYSNEYDRVTYERMENENLLHTLKEQLAFEKEYYQRRQQEFEYLEQVHYDFDRNFTQKEFQNIVQRIREDYQEFNAIRLEELNIFYKTKLETIRTQLTKREEQHEVSKPRETMLAVDTTKKEHRTLIEQNQFLQTKLEQFERDLQQIIEQNRQRYELADREYRQLQNDVPELDCILVQLRETTVDLWSEINTYRYLLVNLLSTNNIKSQQQQTLKVNPPKPLPKPKTIVENTKVKSYPQQYRDETTGFIVHIEDGIIWVRI